MKPYSILFVIIVLCAALASGSCKSKKNPKYNPKKCKTCPTFGAARNNSVSYFYHG